jgi:hypothetical protein
MFLWPFRDASDTLEEINRHEEEMARIWATRRPRWGRSPERFTPSSGNVFRDLGLPNADELLAEADAKIEAMRAERERKALRPEYV